MKKARRAEIEGSYFCLACKQHYDEGTPYEGAEKYKFCPYCGVEIDHSIPPKQAEHLRRKKLKKDYLRTHGLPLWSGTYYMAMGHVGQELWDYSYRLCEPGVSTGNAFKLFKKECAIDRPSYSKFGLYRDKLLLYTYQKEA